jgi:hypothetical protein
MCLLYHRILSRQEIFKLFSRCLPLLTHHRFYGILTGAVIRLQNIPMLLDPPTRPIYENLPQTFSVRKPPLPPRKKHTCENFTNLI